MPTNVRVANCNTPICPIPRGGTASMQADFHPPISHGAMTPEIVAVLGPGITVPYSLPPHLHNACNSLGPGSCPTAPGNLHTFHFNFQVNPAYPPIQLGVRMTLRNPLNNAIVFCTEIQIQVQ